MTYDVALETVRSEWIAAVRVVVAPGEVGRAWKPALDQVWELLRARSEVLREHNLFLYHHAEVPGAPMTVDFGVQVPRPFEPVGNVRCIETPAGEVASTVHIGPYERLGEAHEAIRAWCAAHNRSIGAASWEIYGDPTPDPASTETTIKYLLA